MIFKILTSSQWDTLQTTSEFKGSADDIRDGFIHLSTGAQVQGTLDKHYTLAKTGGADLILLACEGESLEDALKYEVSRNDEHFPHLYGPLPLHVVKDYWVLKFNSIKGYHAPDFIK